MPIDTALHKAANNGDLEGCKEIISSGEVDVNAPGAAERTALQRAVGGNHVECAEALIALGADVHKRDKAGRTALHWASIGGHHKPVEMLLGKYEADPNAKTSSGMTPLHGVAEGNRVEVAKVIIEYHTKVLEGGVTGGKEVDFDLPDCDGKTAAAIAKDAKYPELAKMLKEKRVLKPGEGAGGGCAIS